MTKRFSSKVQRVIVGGLAWVMLVGLVTGCEEVRGFRGKVTLPSGQIVASTKVLRTHYGFDERLPDGRRIIVLDMWDSNPVPLVLLVTLKGQMGGELKVRGDDTAVEAWLIDADHIPMSDGSDWLQSQHLYCVRFAALSEEERSRRPEATRMVGSAKIQS